MPCHARTNRLPIALMAVLTSAAAWSQDVPAADFDASGQVDLDDLALLRQAVGGTDLRFDLDGSGRVDVGDLFRFAESVAEPLPYEPARQPHNYTVRTTRQEVYLSMPEYSARVRHATPFGISALRRRGQRADFAHDDLPLADWEWFWFNSKVLGKRRHKLLEMDWGLPEVRELPDRLEVVYRLPISRIGIDVGVRYSFLASGSSFHVTYSMFNGSRWPMEECYVMLGLPGFSNHGFVTEVASAREQRLPAWPHDMFLTEALARGLAEYQLLRHNAGTGLSEGLKGSVSLQDASGDYRLSSYYLADKSVLSAHSAHTNKPRYLTSHLYITLGDLLPQQERSVTIHHVLTGP